MKFGLGQTSPQALNSPLEDPIISIGYLFTCSADLQQLEAQELSFYNRAKASKPYRSFHITGNQPWHIYFQGSHIEHSYNYATLDVETLLSQVRLKEEGHASRPQWVK